MDYPTTVSKTELGPFMLLTNKLLFCVKKLFSVSLTLAEQGLTRKKKKNVTQKVERYQEETTSQEFKPR